MDYFKHYSTASDSKLINHLFDEFGHHGYAYWFLLLELCAENWDGKTDPKFRFHTRIVRQKLRISQGKLELFLTFCSGFTEVLCNFSKFELEIGIPKLAEVKTSRSVIKSNKVGSDVDIELDIDKELDIDIDAGKKNLPKIKTKVKRKVIEKVSPLAFLFKPDDEIQAWLKNGSPKVQERLLDDNSHHILAEEILKAYIWQSVKTRRKADLFLLNWMTNKKTSGYNPNPSQATFKSKGFGVTPTPENPTGNPYTAQRLAKEKGEIA